MGQGLQVGTGVTIFQNMWKPGPREFQWLLKEASWQVPEPGILPQNLGVCPAHSPGVLESVASNRLVAAPHPPGSHSNCLDLFTRLGSIVQLAREHGAVL